MQNRVIKFRAWDKIKKKIIKDWMLVLDLSGTLVRPHEVDGLEDYPNKDDIILMQFTGLLDKNGKEVYEGDIVMSPYYNTPIVVEWVDGSCGFEPYSESSGNCGHCGGGLNPKRTEIIGNVFENPDLLTNKSN